MQIVPILSALRRSKTAAILVAAQVALTLAIVCNALFVVNARLATSSRPSGVDEDGVFQLHYVGAGEIKDGAAMRQRDLETLRAIPGVVAVSDVNSFPLSTSGWGMGLSIDPSKASSAVSAAAFFGGESVIDAFGLELIEGRDFEASEAIEVDERRNANIEAHTVILSRHLAAKMFPDDATAVGKVVYMGTGDGAPAMRVVGIVDTLMGPGGQASETVYDSFLMPVRYLGRGAHYAVRTEPAQRARVMAEAERALTALRSDRVLVHHRTMGAIREVRYRNERSGAGMLIGVTIGLLLVTASGIVGVASLWVNQRRKQIGVRRALGARRTDIVRYFLTENVLITTLGIAFGIALTIGLNQLLMSRVELARLPITYVGAGMLALWALGVVAVLGPAWRAASVPPAIATRSA